jgi:general stress protein 26
MSDILSPSSRIKKDASILTAPLQIEYQSALKLAFSKLGTHRIMSLAACKDNCPTLRSVSAIITDNKIYFKTDKAFEKTAVLLENPNCAINFWGVAIEGRSQNLGKVNSEFASLYKKFWDKSYTAYAHIETEILFEITPKKIEVWDQDENDKAFFVLIDCETQTATRTLYD